MGYCTDIILVIIALFFPPLPVIIRRGLCTADTVINVALCCLGYIPGTLHSWYIIASFPGGHSERDKYYHRIRNDDEEAAYYVVRGSSSGGSHSQGHTHSEPGAPLLQSSRDHSQQQQGTLVQVKSMSKSKSKSKGKENNKDKLTQNKKSSTDQEQQNAHNYGAVNDNGAGPSSTLRNGHRQGPANNRGDNEAPPPSYAEVVHQSLEREQQSHTNPTDNKQAI